MILVKHKGALWVAKVGKVYFGAMKQGCPNSTIIIDRNGNEKVTRFKDMEFYKEVPRRTSIEVMAF